MKSSLDNLVEISMLMDFYGALLSERQQQIVALYHEENCSLQEISEELGFSNRTQFYKLFRKQYGITPKEYRAQRSAGDQGRVSATA